MRHEDTGNPQLFDHIFEPGTEFLTDLGIDRRKWLIEEEKLRLLLQAAQSAPTAHNKQPQHVLVCRSPEALERVNRCTSMHFGAPVVLVVLADKSRGTYLYDGSLVMANLMLAAHAEGLGSCWIHRAKEEFESEEGKAILKELGIEGDYEGIGHCILGYADGPAPEAKPRKADYVKWVE